MAWISRWKDRRRDKKLTEVFRGLDFDQGFGALGLDFMNGTGVEVRDTDVLRAYDEFAMTVRQLRDRLEHLPELHPESEKTTTSNECRYWWEIANSIMAQLDVCEPHTRLTISAQLVEDRAWLLATRKHYMWHAPETEN
jgi:hypothetical protein